MLSVWNLHMHKACQLWVVVWCKADLTGYEREAKRLSNPQTPQQGSGTRAVLRAVPIPPNPVGSIYYVRVQHSDKPDTCVIRCCTIVYRPTRRKRAINTASSGAAPAGGRHPPEGERIYIIPSLYSQGIFQNLLRSHSQIFVPQLAHRN